MLARGYERQLYTDLNDSLERDVKTKHYMVFDYLDILVPRWGRQRDRGYGFEYRVVNGSGTAEKKARFMQNCIEILTVDD